MTTTPVSLHERNHPVTTAPAKQGAPTTSDELQKTERVLRLIWVIAGGAILFSMLTVTPLVQRVTPDEWKWTAFILPLVVDAAVIIVVRMDSAVSRLGAKAGGWATALRWMTGLFTLGLNIGDSALKGDRVGVAIHAVAPMLLIATSEAIPRYRRTIAAGLDRIAREQASEQARREQQAEAREQRARESREQEQARREQMEREQLQQQERARREQLEHEARIAQEARDHEARLEREREDRLSVERQAELDRQERIRLAEIAAQQRSEQARLDEQRRREQQQREDQQRSEQAAEARREQARAVREQQQRQGREHPEKTVQGVHEPRPLHAVNTPAAAPVNTRKAAAVNTDQIPKDAAVNMIRAAVDADRVSVRGLARETGWSPAWVSGQVAELRGTTGSEDSESTADEAEQVFA